MNQRRSFPLPAQVFFFYILLLALHAPLLSLPYFWDEAGYFIPAARDLLLTGDPIPTSTLSNAHPPLVMLWLALWWKVLGTAFWVTRAAMLMLAALALAAVFRLGERLGGRALGVAAAACTAVYPVFFAQSSMAHLDMAAAAFTLWGVVHYLEGRRALCVTAFAFAALAKETAIVAPLALFAWEVVARKWPRLGPLRAASFAASAALLLAALPLGAWFAYHYARTGYAFGNPEFVAYNLLGTLHPARIALAALRRLWQLFGYMNLFVLTVIAIFAWWTRRHSDRPRGGTPRLELVTFAVVGTAYVVMLSVLGGAVLARYMLPVVPLVIVGSLWMVQQEMRRRRVVVAVVLLSFSVGLFAPSVTASPPEDTLAYRDFIVVHLQAASFLEGMPHATVLTVWPATDELTHPWMGYVSAPLRTVPLKNFSHDELARAPSGFDAVLVYSHHPENRVLRYFPALERWAERWFEGHRDLNAEEVAAKVGGRVVFRAESGQQWVAIVDGGAGLYQTRRTP